MSVELTANTSPETATETDWEPPMPPTDLIFDDGEPCPIQISITMGWAILALECLMS